MRLGMVLLMVLCLLAAPRRALAEAPIELIDATEFSDWYYENPSSITDIGDPQIIIANGAYWCYATSSGAGYRVWRSEDLVNWERLKKHAYQRNRDNWSINQFWAPEVYPYNGRYYLFYSANASKLEGMRIGIAASDAPEGPFLDLSEGPLFDPGYSVIDASFFVDDDGQPYLYYSRDCSDNVVDGVHESHSYGVKLLPDLTGIDGEPQLLVRPDQAWEQDSGPEWLWNEGPIVRKHGDTYWLFYSANYYAGKEYGVGAAQSDNPLGPFEKLPGNPILQYAEQDGEVLVSGPGHNSFLDAPGGETFMVYHTHTDTKLPSGDRQMALDRFGYLADGTPYVNGPTLTPQLLPLEQIGLRNAILDAEMTGDAECLRDGDYGIGRSDAGSRAFTGSARYSWGEPVALRALVIYPMPGATGMVRVTIGDGNVLEAELGDAGTLPGASIRLHFAPVETESLTIESEGALCELIALSDR